MSILDEIKTLEEALMCVTNQIGKIKLDSPVFVHNNEAYFYPSDIGLGIDRFATNCEWAKLLDDYYAPPEARWVEPVPWDAMGIDECKDGIEGAELFYTYGPYDAEIARTNVERYLHEFVRLNGGNGDWAIYWEGGEEDGFGHFYTTDMHFQGIGVISFATEAAAQHIIDAKPELLKTIMGGTK